MRLGWLDASSGVSGDMLLGALHDLGALAGLPRLVASLADLGVTVEASATTRGGIAATAVAVSAPDDQPTRHLAEVRAVVAAADVDPAVKARADAVFDRLAAAEAAAHGIPVSEVHFHEVGAVDSLVDVLGACLGLHTLGLDRLVVSPVALGGGRVSGAHGSLPVPGPAVVALLAGCDLVGYGGPVDVELATPTGVAVLAEWAAESAAMPKMTVSAVGVGAGGRDLPGHPNVARLLVGEPADRAVGSGRGRDHVPGDESSWQVVAANVDDLDPRLWPVVIDALLAAGAADAWLTPIAMKKGRPAHTVSALSPAATVPAVTTALVRHTSTIGVRSSPVAKQELDREWVTVDVAGSDIRVKLARLGGVVVNVSPEFDDVSAAAAATGRPAKELLARASAAAYAVLDGQV